MGTLTYHGVITIPGDDNAGYEDINPPESDGWAHRIQDLELLIQGDESENTTKAIYVIGSIANSPPEEVVEGDAMKGCSVFCATLPYTTNLPRVVQLGLPSDGANIVALGDPLVPDKLRLIATSPKNCTTAKSITVEYRLVLQQVKVSQAQQSELVQRAYAS